MRLLRPQSDPRRRGAALLLSFLVLMVIIAITYQLNRVVVTDQQVGDKNLQTTKMDLAIRSALFEVLEQLREDGEMRQGGGDETGFESSGVDPAMSGDEEAAASNPDAVDCQMDEWAQVQATSIDDVQMRIVIVDEDRKYNVLNMLAEDEDAAEDAYDRVVRILDYCRDNTEHDISSTEADEMARAMRDHMMERPNSILPRPEELLADVEEESEQALPLTMREFLPIEPFEDHHFRDFFDADENRVHAITSYLTCYTSPTTGSATGQAANSAEGGHNVNLNTAPLAVLMGLFDGRDVNGRFWDQVLEYRNEEEELPPPEDGEEAEVMLDEFGQEVIQRQFFDTIDELGEIRDWENMEPEIQGQVESMLRVTSDVFTITITARVPTQSEERQMLEFNSRREQEEYERSGLHLVRSVQAVYWRQIGEDEISLIPLVPWDVLDFAPLPVLDYPEEDD